MSTKAAALLAAADAWRDPEHPPRRDAAERAVRSDRTTEEAAAFACNQFAHACTADALARWERPGGPWLERVVVRQQSDVPLLGVRAFVAACVAARRVFLDASEPMLQAFAADVASRLEGPFLLGDAPTQPDAVLGAGGAGGAEGAVPAWTMQPVPPQAVIDGEESEEEWIGLAEDLLLHDGQSPRSPRVVWAPDGLAPDSLLDAMAGFRELFPARAALDGLLQMPRAFLEAADVPHAWAPGFLLSKGDPEVQGPGHVRWATYSALADVVAPGPSMLIASPRLQVEEAAVIAPGEAHRPPLAGLDENASPFSFLERLRLS